MLGWCDDVTGSLEESELSNIYVLQRFAVNQVCLRIQHRCSIYLLTIEGSTLQQTRIQSEEMRMWDEMVNPTT